MSIASRPSASKPRPRCAAHSDLPLDEHLLDLEMALGLRPLGRPWRHSGCVAVVEPERVLKIVDPLAARRLPRHGYRYPAVRLQQDAGLRKRSLIHQ